MKRFKFIVVAIATVFVFSGCGNNNIEGVKDAILSEYSSSVTLGDALEYWAKQQGCTPKWEEFETERKEKVVNFTCLGFPDDNFFQKADKHVGEYLDAIAFPYPASMLLVLVKNQGYNIEQFKKWEQEYKQINSFKFVIQFLMSVDNKTFEEGYSGFYVHLFNYETYKTQLENDMFLTEVYKGEKIDTIIPSFDAITGIGKFIKKLNE